MKSKTEIDAGQIYAALRKQPGLIANEIKVLMGKDVTSTLTRMERYQLLRRVKTRNPKSDVAKKTYVFEYHPVGRHFVWPSKEFRAERDAMLKRKRPTAVAGNIQIEPGPIVDSERPAPPVFKAQLPIRPEPDRPCPRSDILAKALALPVGELILLRKELNSRIAELVA